MRALSLNKVAESEPSSLFRNWSIYVDFIGDPVGDLEIIVVDSRNEETRQSCNSPVPHVVGQVHERERVQTDHASVVPGGSLSEHRVKSVILRFGGLGVEHNISERRVGVPVEVFVNVDRPFVKVVALVQSVPFIFVSVHQMIHEFQESLHVGGPGISLRSDIEGEMASSFEMQKFKPQVVHWRK